MIKKLAFQPLRGFGSRHLQTIVPAWFFAGAAPPSKSWLVELENGDHLSCEVSTPLHWKESCRTVVLVHGMGGSHSSSYMIRMSQKIYRSGNRVVRVNLRGCGSGKGLSKLPYNGGTSGDLLKVLQVLKRDAPASELVLTGFSLGGNIVLKLAGELGSEAGALVKMFIAVCPPVDLAQTVSILQEKRNRFYHSYYLKKICHQAEPWLSQKIRTLCEFDDLVTAPLWGYKGASGYYQECSSLRFLSNIQQSTHLLFAEDDPFISFESLKKVSLPSHVQVWVAGGGGHMGFLGKGFRGRSCFWMDHLLLKWIELV